MKERPILFSAPMIRAILDGSKTQTRRIVKHDPGPYWNPVVGLYNPIIIENGGYEAPGPEIFGASDETHGRKFPYGQPGDKLWVRETWGVVSNDWDENGNMIDWVPDRPATAIHEMPFGQGYYSGHAIYAADGVYEWAGDDDGGGEPRSAWHPSIHMPRAASRILLEIASVRVERLNDISDVDALAEGAKGGHGVIPSYHYNATPSEHFSHIWESINGAGSWEANPFVWVVEFKRVAP